MEGSLAQNKIRPLTVSFVALTAIISLGLGAGSAVFLTSPSQGSAFIPIITNGPWQTSPGLGAKSADPWTRAYVSRVGLLALPRDEAIYFTATLDSDGQDLRSDVTYRVSGAFPPVGWWSLTAYGEDDYLMPSVDHHYSVNSSQFTPSNVEFTVGPRALSINEVWIETAGDQAIALSIRFYRHPGWTNEDLETLTLPKVERVGP